MRAARPLFSIGIAAVLAFSSGCGIGLQTVLGWHDHSTAKRSEPRPVAVTSVPRGAVVVRRDPDGKETTLGSAPLTDMHTLSVEQEVNRPATLGLWLGFGVETAAMLAAVATHRSSTTDSSGGSGDFTPTDSGGTSDFVTMLTGAFALAAITDLIVVLVHGAGTEEVLSRNVQGGAGEFAYTARISGLPDAQGVVRVPEQSAVELVLDRNASPPAQANQVATQAATQVATRKEPSTSGGNGGVRGDPSWVIAVMNVEDSNADNAARAIDRGLVRNLGDQIRVFVAQQGVHTIDRGAQERILREQIASMKKESYKTCYDDSCQVELGKALAASHILRTRITRFGARCVLNGELIDLRAEVTMAAASSQGTCEAEGFLNMGEEVARNLVRK